MKVAYDLLDVSTDLVKNMQRDFKRSIGEKITTISKSDLFETANSYFGLFRQATNGRQERVRLANVLRRRGHSISGDLSKTYRKKS